jgi:hypothetical protein
VRAALTSVVGSKPIDVLCYNATSMRIVPPNPSPDCVKSRLLKNAI